MASDLPPATSVTQLLDAAQRGDAGATEQLLALTYAELRRIAERHMRGERPDHTLQPTALLHDAFLRLLGGSPMTFHNRTHFLRTASQTMRRVLVDHARIHNAAKRGAGLRVTFDESAEGVADQPVDMLALDEALTRLAEAEPRCARVVELRFFAGLEVTEVAEMLEVSTATVKRDWRFARAWLADELSQTPGGA